MYTHLPTQHYRHSFSHSAMASAAVITHSFETCAAVTSACCASHAAQYSLASFAVVGTTSNCNNNRPFFNRNSSF